MKEVTKEDFYKNVDKNQLADPMPQTSEIEFKKESGLVINAITIWRTKNRNQFGKIITDYRANKTQYFLV